jgi:hypothetical protein
LTLVADYENQDQPAGLDSGSSDLVGEMGPAMRALTEKQRRFVLALYELPAGRGALTRAAQRAGYGGNHKSTRQIAHALWQNEKIRKAFAETGYRYIGVTSVAAIQAARELLFKPNHPDHLKACRMFIDRGWPLETLSKQQIDVTHTQRVELDPRVMLRMAEQLNVPLEKLMGTSRPPEEMSKLFGPDWREPKLFDATPIEINGEDRGTEQR